MITIEICGEFVTCGTDKDICASITTHGPTSFPHVHDRRLFVRQAANVWLVKERLHYHVRVVSGHVGDPVQVIDTLPLPVCGYGHRGGHDLLEQAPPSPSSGAADGAIVPTANPVSDVCLDIPDAPLTALS